MTASAGTRATEPVQLLLYRFKAGAVFEGHLVGALERLESGGALRLLELLVVASDPASGDIVAADLHGNSAGGMVAPLLTFRLEAAERLRATRRALTRHGDLVGNIAATLEPGEAIAALLIGHVWAHALDQAVVRTQGTELASEMVETAALSDHANVVLAAARQR